MTYQIILMRDDNVILEREISSDQVIDLLTAGTEPPQPPEVAPEVPIKKVKGQRLCSNCSKPGHTSRTCKGASASKPAPKKEPLSEKIFDLVKQRKEDGDLDSGELALEFGVPLREVNVAIFSPNYGGYLARRQRDDVL